MRRPCDRPADACRPVIRGADYREALLEAAQLADSIGAVDLLVQATLANNRGVNSGVGHVDIVRRAVIDRALERVDPADQPERAQLLAVACLERVFDGDFDTHFALRPGLPRPGMGSVHYLLGMTTTFTVK